MIKSPFHWLQNAWILLAVKERPYRTLNSVYLCSEFSTFPKNSLTTKVLAFATALVMTLALSLSLSLSLSHTHTHKLFRSLFFFSFHQSMYVFQSLLVFFPLSLSPHSSLKHAPINLELLVTKFIIQSQYNVTLHHMVLL